MKTLVKGLMLCALLSSSAFAANEVKTVEKTVHNTKERIPLTTSQKTCIEKKIGNIERSTVSRETKDRAFTDCGVNLAYRKPHMKDKMNKTEYMEDNVNVQKSSTIRDTTDWKDVPEEAPIIAPTK